jgi:PKD repeat protein
VTFNSAGSTDPDGGPLYVSWNFDDPASGTRNVASSPSAQHSFSAGGVYKVHLVVVDDEGSTDSEVASITVGASAAPTADFSSTVSPTNPLRVAFTDASTGTVTAWAWDFGDLGSSTQKNPTHDYATGGTYTVRLTVTGPDGSDSQQSNITVDQSAPPVASFASSVSQSDPLQVTFTDHTTGTVASWLWDFGDLGTSNLQNPVHAYAADGDYTVRLTVSGPDGTDSSEQVVHIDSSGGGDPTGGGCAAQIGRNGRPGGDASLPLAIAVALGIAALRARGARRAPAMTR